MDDSALILYLEDNPRDAEIVRDKLQQTPSLACELRVASNRAEYEAALAEARFDLILSDYRLPNYDGMAALALARANQSDVPFILISGTLGEEQAVDCVLRGATDYVLKQRLERLVPAVLRALAEAKERRKSRQAEESLRQSELKYRQVVENAIESIFVAQDGRLVFLNAATSLVFGHSGEELLARPFVDFIYPDDRTMVLGRHQARTKGEESPSVYDFRVVHKDGAVRWVEVKAVLVDWQGKPATLNLLSDISARKQAEEALRRSFEATLNTLSRAAERRDPYTAGHQRRVTELALAIFRKLGRPDAECDALRIAGILHDIGKLAIPTEILCKPGTLSAIEFELIRTHPQAAYDILGDAVFPGPVAEIILQHHERLDGSGYPQKLRGDAILLEARTLAVADVVEAMSSNRPYRPALGIDAALNEIRAGRGTRYDAEIVDTCMKLFEAGEFSFAAKSSIAC